MQRCHAVLVINSVTNLITAGNGLSYELLKFQFHIFLHEICSKNPVHSKSFGSRGLTVSEESFFSDLQDQQRHYVPLKYQELITQLSGTISQNNVIL
jgi:hypothetical protein